MYKILITGAGSAQANGVINCLLKDPEENYIIGCGADRYDIMLCKAHKKILVPHSSDANYKEHFLNILNDYKPHMVHFCHDKEILIASTFRNEIEKLGIRMLIPDTETIKTCVSKYKTWEKFKKAGIKVPENYIINKKADLKKAFAEIANKEGFIWLRPMHEVGGGALGARPIDDIDKASILLDEVNGWGKYSAATMLPGKSVTWMAIFYEGELICAQGRERLDWAFKALSPSGVTGITRIGTTYSSARLEEMGMNACKAVSLTPHGVYGVDFTYDHDGIPNPTEINIGRFFTTVEFFAQAGLNMPLILKELCLYGKKPAKWPLINPLPNNLLWIRGMDSQPCLLTEYQIQNELNGN